MAISTYKTTSLYAPADDRHPYTLSVAFEEKSVNATANTSRIAISTRLHGESISFSYNGGGTLALYWHDNRTNTDTLVASESVDKCGMSFGDKFISDEIVVEHNDDGTLSGYARAYFTKNKSSNYIPTSGGVATNLTELTPIARTEKIMSATDFNDNENPSLTFTDNTNYNCSVALNFKKNSGEQLYYVESSHDITSPYIFDISEYRNAILAVCQDGGTKISDSSISYLVDYWLWTYNGGTLVGGNNLTKTFTITNAQPTETHTFAETETSVSSFFGDDDSGYVIKNLSKPKITVIPTGIKNAEISSVVISCGDGQTETLTTSPYEKTFNNIGSGTFTIVVTDNRGLSTQSTITRTLVEYEPVKINTYSFVRDNPTSSEIILNADIKYYNSNIGGVMNTPVIKWRLGTSGSYNSISSEDYDIDTTNHKITISNLSLGQILPYNQQGTIYLYVSDLLTNTSQNAIVTKGIPTMDLGENDLCVNGTLYIADTNGENKVDVMNEATASSKGLMSSTDKTKLDGIIVEDFYSQVIFNETPANVTFRRYGKVVTISYQGENTTHRNGAVLFTLPSGYYPTSISSGPNNFYYFPFVKNANAYGNVLLRTTGTNAGQVSINQISSTSATGRIYFQVSYILE